MAFQPLPMMLFNIALLVLVFQLAINVAEGSSSSCNLFNGNWVMDPSYPLYDSTLCPFIEKEFNCQKNGRPDQLYLKYRWQPHGCNLPRYKPIYIYNLLMLSYACAPHK